MRSRATGLAHDVRIAWRRPLRAPTSSALADRRPHRARRGLRAGAARAGLEHLAWGGAAHARQTPDRQRRSLGRVLVVAEVGLAMALLVAGGFLLRTFIELQRVALGCEPRGVLTVESRG